MNREQFEHVIKAAADLVNDELVVIGSQAARHPGIVRMLVRDGDELGNHTFTHVALSNGPAWQARAQPA